MGKTIWYISKYAVSPNFGPPSRQFFFSKYFNIKGFKTILISSYACGTKYSTNIDFEKYYKIFETEGIKHYLLKGPMISLGFSFKRILSWVQYEWYVFKLGNEIGKKQKPDAIIISSLSLLTIINGIYFKWKFGCKFILEIRDIWPLTLIEIGGFSKYNPIILILGYIEKLGYKHSDIIIGTMPNLKDHVNKIFPSKKIETIPHGLDFSFFDQKDLSAYSKFIIDNLDKNKFNIVYTGTIGKANNLSMVLKAFNIISESSDKIVIHIIGSGPQKHEFEHEYSSNEHIIFYNPIPKQEVPLFLSYFNLNLASSLPSSLYRFGISFNKLNEYLLSGNPTLLIYDGYKSVIEEADAGFVISSLNFENIVTTILNISNMNVATLKQKGKNGREYALKNLDYSILSEKYLKIIFPSL